MVPVTHVTQSEGLGLGAASLLHTDFGHRQRDPEQHPFSKGSDGGGPRRAMQSMSFVASQI